MNISPIQQSDNSTSFKATIIRTIPMNEFVDLMKRRGETQALKLWGKVELAVTKHPSQHYIFTDLNYMYDQKNSIRGILNTTKDLYLDQTIKNTPSQAIWSSWKNLLNPENKNDFHKLFGEQYTGQYKGWWDKYIAPIWDELSKIC